MIGSAGSGFPNESAVRNGIYEIKANEIKIGGAVVCDDAFLDWLIESDIDLAESVCSIMNADCVGTKTPYIAYIPNGQSVNSLHVPAVGIKVHPHVTVFGFRHHHAFGRIT